MLLSFFKGDDGEFCDDELGTACEFEGELLSHIVTDLFGMIGDDDDVIWVMVGDTDGERLFNALFWYSKPVALLLLLTSSVAIVVPFMLPFDGDVVIRYTYDKR